MACQMLQHETAFFSKASEMKQHKVQAKRRISLTEVWGGDRPSLSGDPPAMMELPSLWPMLDFTLPIKSGLVRLFALP